MRAPDFAAFWVAMMLLATRAFLPQRAPADPVLPWFLGVFWLVALFLVGWAAHKAWRAWRQGRSALYLDSPPPRVGGWISGQVRAPKRLHGAENRLHVDCIKTSRGVGRSGTAHAGGYTRAGRRTLSRQWSALAAGS